jgi:hypothetical protein
MLKVPPDAAWLIVNGAVVESSVCVAWIVAFLAARSGFENTVKFTEKSNEEPPPPPPGRSEIKEGAVTVQ